MRMANPIRRWNAGWLVVVSLLAGCVAPVFAEFEGADLSLRFPAAISRFATYADVAAAGGAQAASVWSSSLNPASAAWPHPERQYENSVSPQFAAILFQQNNSLFVGSEAATFDAHECGVFLPAAAQIRSNTAMDRNGAEFQFTADYFQLQWGKQLAADWAVGANFNLTTSDMRFDVGKMLAARSQGESYDFRLGAVHQVTQQLRAGLVFDCGFAPTRTLALDPLAPPALRRAGDTTQQFLIRPGIVWQYGPSRDLYVDYQAANFFNDTGTLWAHRFAVGVDHMLVKDILYGRLGTTVDTRGNAAATTGLGVTLSPRIGLDVAYQYNMFPEIRPEFGTAHSVVASVGIGF